MVNADTGSVPVTGLRKTNPMESAAEKVDEMIEDIKEDTETTGNKIDDAIDEVRDDIDDTPE